MKDLTDMTYLELTVEYEKQLQDLIKNILRNQLTVEIETDFGLMTIEDCDYAGLIISVY